MQVKYISVLNTFSFKNIHPLLIVINCDCLIMKSRSKKCHVFFFPKTLGGSSNNKACPWCSIFPQLLRICFFHLPSFSVTSFINCCSHLKLSLFLGHFLSLSCSEPSLDSHFFTLKTCYLLISFSSVYILSLSNFTISCSLTFVYNYSSGLCALCSLNGSMSQYSGLSLY